MSGKLTHIFVIIVSILVKNCNVLSCVLASESGQGCASHTEGCNGATGTLKKIIEIK